MLYDQPLDLEEAFNEYTADLVHNAPDGIIEINLPVLYELGLLNCDQVPPDQRKLTQYFHVIESNEKVTLFNDKFVIWNLPRIIDEQPTTYTLVGIHEGKKTTP